MRSGTRIEAVMSDIQDKINARQYLPGVRLLSVRAQAKVMKVSVSTVVEAYDRLVAEGVIESKPGAGFFVSGPVAPLALTQMGPKLDREVDPLWVSRQSLDSDQDSLKPGCGWLPPERLYQEGIRRALRGVARDGELALTDYATPLGHDGFRQYVQRRLLSYGVEARSEQVMLTESGTQAIDLVCRFLLEPGDTVLVDDPCYFNFHALLKAHRVKVVGVPYTPQGPCVEAFSAALKEHSPRLYITNSGVHNPTGASLSPGVAHRLLKLAEQSDLIIVEDDIFAELEMNVSPRLAAFDGLARVIQIGSFSKTVSAAVRCGYIAAREDWIEQLIDLKIATSFGGSRLGAEIVLQTLTDSGYRKHMERLRVWLARQRDITVRRLTELGIVPWHVPTAGMFLWCQLPSGIDATALARMCLQQGVVLAPGNAFSQSQSAHDFLRFNVSQCTDERVFQVLAQALDSLNPHLGAAGDNQ